MANKHKKSSGPNMSTIMMVTVLLLIGGIGIFAIVKSFLPGMKEQVQDPNKPYTINYEGQPHIGKENAPVKLMEFGDFKCPHCKTFHDKIFPQLKKDFIDTGKVQMFFGNYAFIGEDSKTAAQAGESVFKQNNDAFWKYYDVVYANQKDAQAVWATPGFLLDLIKKNIPEVDVTKVSEDLKNNTFNSAVQSDNQLAQTLKIDEVPKIFINGKKMKNSLNYPELKKMIESELQNK